MSASDLPDAVCSITIAVPVEKVWAEITKTGSIQRPLYNTVLDIDLEPGGRLRYSSPDGKRFESKAQDLGIADSGWGWDGDFADFDADGDLDLLVMNGYFSGAEKKDC